MLNSRLKAISGHYHSESELYKRRRLSQEEISERYPLLIRALKFVLLGTDTEAVCVISCYRQGIDYGGEACSHSGLTTADRLVDATSFNTRRQVRLQDRLIAKD